MKKHPVLFVVALSLVLTSIVALCALSKNTKDIEFKGFGVSFSTK